MVFKHLLETVSKLSGHYACVCGGGGVFTFWPSYQWPQITRIRLDLRSMKSHQLAVVSGLWEEAGNPGENPGRNANSTQISPWTHSRISAITKVKPWNSKCCNLCPFSGSNRHCWGLWNRFGSVWATMWLNVTENECKLSRFSRTLFGSGSAFWHLATSLTGICGILQIPQWLMSPWAAWALEFSSNIPRHGNQQQQQHICSSHLPAALSVMIWLRSLFFSSPCEQGLKRSPSFSTGILAGGLFLASSEAWSHLSKALPTFLNSSISGEGGVRVSLHGQKRLNLQQIQKLSCSLLFRRNRHKWDQISFFLNIGAGIYCHQVAETVIAPQINKELHFPHHSASLLNKKSIP